MNAETGERELSSEDLLEFDGIVNALRRHQRHYAKHIAELQKTKARIDQLLSKLEGEME